MANSPSASNGQARLKVCGITRPEDLQFCVAEGVDFVGINLWPGSKRGLSVDAAEALFRDAGMLGQATARQGCRVVGLVVDPPRSLVDEAVARLPLDFLQFHGDQGSAVHQPGDPPLVHVIRGTPSIEDFDFSSLNTLPPGSWTLLDAAVPGYGGHGVRTDWAWAATFVERAAPNPVYLAGGITPENAAQALAQVHPAGLDVASGSELMGARRGEKDHEKIRALLSTCRRPSLS